MECLGQLRTSTSLHDLTCAGGVGGRVRKPITALAADLKGVLSASTNPLLAGNSSSGSEGPRFYLDLPTTSNSSKEDRFFEDVSSLYQRQTVLFQRSCEQLQELNEYVPQEPSTLTSNSSNTSNSTASTSRIMLKRANNGNLTQPSPSPFGEADSADVEELYVDCLYTVLHMIGADIDTSDQFGLVEHLRKAFRVEPQTHLRLYEIASARKPPKAKLHLSVLEARSLASKDISGVNDAFCTFYLSSKPSDCLNTGCKVKALNPVWNESFELELPDDWREAGEVLHLDVWNFLPDEKFRERIKRLGEVRDSRGFRHFLVEALGTSKSGRGLSHRLIGSLEIPLAELPASGAKNWWAIDKLESNNNNQGQQNSQGKDAITKFGRRKSSVTSLPGQTPSEDSPRKRGELHLVLHLSTSSKPHEEVVSEHKRLLRVLLSYELLKRNSPPYSWRDAFSKETLKILAQHAVQGRMTREETALTRWFVYAQAHAILPLDLRVFTPVLEKVRSCPSVVNDADFHASADAFVSQCVSFIRKHRFHIGSNLDKYAPQLQHLLQCLHTLHVLKWRTKNDIVLSVEEALVKSLREWMAFVREKIDVPPKDLERRRKEICVERMIGLIRILHVILADLSASRKRYQSIFQESLNIDYVELAHREYESELSPLAKDIVEDATELLKAQNVAVIEDSVLVAHDDEDDNEKDSGGNASSPAASSDFGLGMKLFELYLTLQQFYKSKKASAKDKDNDLKLDAKLKDYYYNNKKISPYPYHSWFILAVAKWLDIALFKAIKRILKAVELDNLLAVDDLVRYTSSAVDLRTVLAQLRTFWLQLRWPDAETAYVFISRILDDVCRAAVFYAEKMCGKVERLQQHARSHDGGLYYSREQCYAVNNVDFMLGVMNPLVVELGTTEVMNELEEQNGVTVADACRKTIKTLVKNAIENVENQILQIFEQLGAQLAPTICRYLLESMSASMPQRRANHTKLLQFLDEHLIFLKEYLVPDNFERALAVLWAICISTLSDLVRRAIGQKSSVPYFAHLYEAFRILLNFFHGDESAEVALKDPSVHRLSRQLRLYASDPRALIGHYMACRHAEQSIPAEGTFPHGSLTVRALLQNRHLRIEILNARHLKPVDVVSRLQEAEVEQSGGGRSRNRSGSGTDSFTSSSASSSSSFFSIYSTYPRRRHPLPPPREPPKTGPSRLLDVKVPTLDPRRGLSGSDLDIYMSASSSGQRPPMCFNDGAAKLDFLRNKLDLMRLSVQEAHVAVHKNFTAHGRCNPYVTMSVILSSGLPSIKIRTVTQHRTLFPLFDETFDLVLPSDIPLSGSFLHLSVKDRAVMGEGILLGEAYLPLSELFVPNLDVRLEELPQRQLKLTRPSSSYDDLLFALQMRSNDNFGAREFLRKERRKRLL